MGVQDSDQFEALFREHHAAIAAYARRRGGDPDEVVAETFAVAWRRRDGIRQPERAWLYRTAANVMSNQRRAEARRERLQHQLRAVGSVAADSTVPGFERVHEALSRLSPPDREILRLSAWEQLDSASIGIVIGCSAAAARVRVFRARRKFEEIWAQSPDPPPVEPAPAHDSRSPVSSGRLPTSVPVIGQVAVEGARS